ncbi:MAG: hypothetical protein K8I00_07620 [Candidatus Omnitrophica bacterium]|nr:hypothetical protein [Candidatus Omnitrophota bacterium]
MDTILVEHRQGDAYKVTVQQKTTTEHVVTLAPAYHQKLTGGAVSKEELLKKSFAFLLEREDNTMILHQFELPVIQRYFPDYEKTMRCSI